MKKKTYNRLLFAMNVMLTFMYADELFWGLVPGNTLPVQWVWVLFILSFINAFILGVQVIKKAW